MGGRPPGRAELRRGARDGRRLGPRLATEAARRGALEVDRWEGSLTRRARAILRPALILADGAAWIWGLADEYVDQRVEVSDFYHAAEHLHAAATAWADARTAELLTRGPAPVLAAFDRATPASSRVAKARRTERAYFAGRVDRMASPTLRLDGLPLGSGAIEFAADRVVQRRMKRAGMRRSPAGGDAVLALRARLRSRRPLAA